MPFLKNVASGRTDTRRQAAGSRPSLRRSSTGSLRSTNSPTSRPKKLEKLLSAWGYDLPVYVGMRNWHPFIKDSLERMREDGVKNLVGLIMAVYRSDASWERYMRDVSEACEDLGMELHVEYVPPLFNHPLFIEGSAAKVTERMQDIPESRLDTTMLVFTAHSIS